MRFYLIVVATTVLLSGCRTSNQNANFVDGENIPLRLDPDERNSSAVPAFLWSPSRRKATSGYYYLVSEYMSLSGEQKKVLPLIETAYNLDPNPFLAGKLISGEILVGKKDKALPEAKRMILLYPKSAELHFLYGKLLAQHGFYRNAESELERAIDLGGGREEFYLELIILHQALRKYPKAIAVAKEMVKMTPHSIKAWISLARLYLATGQKKKGLPPARRAYEMQSSNPENVLIYALALEMNGKSKKAISLYEQLYRLNPTNEELISRMIELYRSVGDLEESLELLNEAAEMSGGNRPGVQLQRAIILWELNRFEEAAVVLDQLASDYPEQHRLRYMAGLGREKLKKLDQAYKIFESIPKSSQFWGVSRIRMAMIRKNQNKPILALDIVNLLLKEREVPVNVYVLAGSIYGDLKKYEEAVAIIGKGYDSHQDIKLLFLKGVYYEKNGAIDDCIKVMREVIRLDSTYSTAYNYLGYLYAERGENLEEAESLINKALELKPNDGYYLDSLGWVYYQQGKYIKAYKTLKDALKVLPNEGVILEHLGDTKLKQKEAGEAIKFFERSLNTKLEDKDRRRIEDKLNRLREQKKE